MSARAYSHESVDRFVVSSSARVRERGWGDTERSDSEIPSVLSCSDISMFRVTPESEDWSAAECCTPAARVFAGSEVPGAPGRGRERVAAALPDPAPTLARQRSSLPEMPPARVARAVLRVSRPL